MPNKTIVVEGNSESRKSVLQAYYARYLTEVRGVSDASVKKYINALKNISQKLKAKDIVEADIYEIMDLNELFNARKVLLEDPDFVLLDTRGNRMYSAGLNHYCRFASGDGFMTESTADPVAIVKRMDIPIDPENPRIVSRIEWNRSNILREQALSFANYACEINRDHKSFVAENTQKAYMEGHHAIPMNNQPQFNQSLDIYANIVCLCPICHRRIHHGLRADRISMMNMLYEKRAERLANSGIRLSKDEFVQYAL